MTKEDVLRIADVLGPISAQSSDLRQVFNADHPDVGPGSAGDDPFGSKRRGKAPIGILGETLLCPAKLRADAWLTSLQR
jgi:hypothetical protein